MPYNKEIVGKICGKICGIATSKRVHIGSLLKQSAPPDAAPTGLTLTVVDRTDIKLDWTDNASNEDGYKIERSLNGVDFTVIDTVAADTETYTDEDLDEDTQYYYRIRAYKGAEYSAYTDTEDETTGSTAFKITVDTTKAGSASDTFVLPLYNGETYNFHVKWGDGNEEDVSGSSLTEKSHQYSSGGTYQIAITGTFPRIYFNNGGDKLKLISIDNWGTIVWSSMEYAFRGCSNNTNFPSDNNSYFNSSLISGSYTFAGNKFDSLPEGLTFESLESGGLMFIGVPLTSLPSTTILSSLENGNYMFNSTSLTSLPNNIVFPSLSNGTQMFTGVTINTERYSKLLVDIEANNSNSSVNFHGGNSKYNQDKVDEGTTDGTTADKLVDSTQNFLTTVTVGDVIHNTTDGTYARVTAVDSDTTLSLDNDIMVSGETYVVQHSDAAKARASLILDDNWTITDGGAA